MKSHKNKQKDRKATLDHGYGAALVGSLGHSAYARRALFAARHPRNKVPASELPRLREVANWKTN